MLINNVDNSYVAISYDTATFRDLQFYILQYQNINLLRVEPEEFFSNPQKHCQYINLIVKDFDLRESVSKFLNDQQLNRFSFVHPMAMVDGAVIGQGVFLYQFSTVYPGSILCDDVIVHAYGGFAHNCKCGQGTVISGNVIITGNVTIGEFCFLGASVTILNNIILGDKVNVGAGATVRKSIKQPGTYYTKSDLKKLRNINNTASRSR